MIRRQPGYAEICNHTIRTAPNETAIASPFNGIDDRAFSGALMASEASLSPHKLLSAKMNQQKIDPGFTVNKSKVYREPSMATMLESCKV
mmetsp:Transcript_22114/g.47491  ORF Transcript_22114/g.47491 Transcript_22114/m.47491 type:complete len:90 (+) Transcript_22114:719-988(+)